MDEIQKIEGTPDYIACKIVCDFYEHERVKRDFDIECLPGELSVWVSASFIDARDFNKPRINVDGSKRFAREKLDAVRAFWEKDLGMKNETFPNGDVNPIRYVITRQIYEKAKQHICPQEPTPIASQEKGDGKVEWWGGYPNVVQ